MHKTFTKFHHKNATLGGHLGRDKTTQKIAERFYWKNLWSYVRQFVQHCDTCQHTNDAKFQKQAAPLHPIPVKSKVWDQVCGQCVQTDTVQHLNLMDF